MARPSKYTEISKNLDKVEELARNGFTDEEIAMFLGIDRTTLYDWKRKYPEFSYILKKGKMEADNEVIKSLYKRAIGYEYFEDTVEYSPDHEQDKEAPKTNIIKMKRTKKLMPPNVMAIVIWLYNRRRQDWKQKQHELQDNLPTIPEFDSMTDDELLKLVREGMKTISE